MVGLTHTIWRRVLHAGVLFSFVFSTFAGPVAPGLVASAQTPLTVNNAAPRATKVEILRYKESPTAAERLVVRPTRDTSQAGWNTAFQYYEIILFQVGNSSVQEISIKSNTLSRLSSGKDEFILPLKTEVFSGINHADDTKLGIKVSPVYYMSDGTLNRSVVDSNGTAVYDKGAYSIPTFVKDGSNLRISFSYDTSREAKNNNGNGINGWIFKQGDTILNQGAVGSHTIANPLQEARYSVVTTYTDGKNMEYVVDKVNKDGNLPSFTIPLTVDAEASMATVSWGYSAGVGKYVLELYRTGSKSMLLTKEVAGDASGFQFSELTPDTFYAVSVTSLSPTGQSISKGETKFNTKSLNSTDLVPKNLKIDSKLQNNSVYRLTWEAGYEPFTIEVFEGGVNKRKETSWFTRSIDLTVAAGKFYEVRVFNKADFDAAKYDKRANITFTAEAGTTTTPPPPSTTTPTTDCRTTNTCYKLPSGQDLWSLFPAGTSITEINKLLNLNLNVYAPYSDPKISNATETSVDVTIRPYEALGYGRWVKENGGWEFTTDPTLNVKTYADGTTAQITPQTCINQGFQIRYMDITDLGSDPTEQVKSTLAADSSSWPTFIGGLSEHESLARTITNTKEYDKAYANLLSKTSTFKLSGLKAGRTYVLAYARQCWGTTINTIVLSKSFQTLMPGTEGSGGTITVPVTWSPKLATITDVVAGGGELTSPQGEYTHVLSLTFPTVEGASDYRILRSTGDADTVLVDRLDNKPYALGKHIDAGSGKIKFNILLKGGEKNIYYTLAVVALNKDNIPSDPKWGSYVLEDPFSQKPLPVTGLKVDAASVTQTKVNLTWNDTTCYNFPVSKTFQIFKGEESVGSTSNRHFEVTGLSQDTNYTFGVKVICDSTGLVDKGSKLESPLATTTVRTLKGLTGNFTIEGRVEPAGKYDDGTPAYRLIVKRTSSVSGVEDKWLASMGNTISSSGNGLYNFLTNTRDGEGKTCENTGFCVYPESRFKGYAACMTGPGGQTYENTQPNLLLNKNEAVLTQYPAGLSRSYVTMVGLTEGGPDHKDLCNNIASAPIKSNEIFLDIPSLPDSGAPTLSFTKILTNDRVANDGFVTGKQLTFVFTADDDKDLSKCTVDYGKGEKDIACVKGQNESPFILGDDVPTGEVTFKLTAIDGSNKRTTQMKTYVFDQTMPVFSSNVSSGFVASLTNLQLSCTDVNGSGCASMQYKVGAIGGACANEVNGWVDVPANQLNLFTLPSIPENATAMCARGRDLAGNFNEGKKIPLNVDTQIPEVTLEPVLDANLKVHNGILFTSKEEISLRLTEVSAGVSGIASCDITGDLVSVSDLDKTKCTATNGVMKIKLNAGEGLKSLVMKVKNGAGKEGVKQIDVHRDTAVPQFEANTAIAANPSMETNGDGTVQIIPAASKDNVAVALLELSLSANGKSVNLTQDMLVTSVPGVNILNNKVVISADATGNFHAEVWKSGIQIKKLPTIGTGGSPAYNVEQRVFDKAGNSSAEAKSKSFAFSQTTNTDPITVTGGSVQVPATLESNTLPLNITFSASPVYYTVTENAVESSKVLFGSSIFLPTGDRTISIKFYDGQNRQIGTTYGPYTVKVVPKGALVTFQGGDIERTKEVNATLAISSIVSAAEKVTYKVMKDGVQVATGERNKQDYASALSLPATALTPNTVNDFTVVVTDPAGNVTSYKKSIVHDTKAPEVKNVQGQLGTDQVIRFAFSIDDLGNTPLSSVKARLIDVTTGQYTELNQVPLANGAGKDYTVGFTAIAPRPGHEYIVAVQTEDALGNKSEEVRSAATVTKPKSALDLLDMFQKSIAVDSSIVNTDRVKVTLSNGKNVQYVAEMPRGKAIVFRDLLSAGQNEKRNNQKETKLPVGAYNMTIETVGASVKKQQVIGGYIVDPYYTDTNGDLNGDGFLGMADRELFLAAKKANKYSTTDSSVVTLTNSIDSLLRSNLLSNVVNYLRN